MKDVKQLTEDLEYAYSSMKIWVEDEKNQMISSECWEILRANSNVRTNLNKVFTVIQQLKRINMKNDFTKSDLKVGMSVLIREGSTLGIIHDIAD